MDNCCYTSLRFRFLHTSKIGIKLDFVLVRYIAIVTSHRKDVRYNISSIYTNLGYTQLELSKNILKKIFRAVMKFVVMYLSQSC